MFGMFKSDKVIEISPAEAHQLLKAGKITLVDVREPGECARVRIPGAINAPLSDLEAHLRRLPAGKPVVFHCLSGKRSNMAIARCKSLGQPHDTHVAGGIAAWQAAGLPVEP